MLACFCCHDALAASVCVRFVGQRSQRQMDIGDAAAVKEGIEEVARPPLSLIPALRSTGEAIPGRWERHWIEWWTGQRSIFERSRHAQTTIPREYYVVRHVQNTKDHCLGPRWTRVLHMRPSDLRMSRVQTRHGHQSDRHPCTRASQPVHSMQTRTAHLKLHAELRQDHPGSLCGSR